MKKYLLTGFAAIAITAIGISADNSRHVSSSATIASYADTTPQGYNNSKMKSSNKSMKSKRRDSTGNNMMMNDSTNGGMNMSTDSTK